ncbi:MAG: hypothetical protein R3246_00950 [Acidimicrobiia bacterium]|nr:hypothetical protein [Acidimicrobiia bacterium]
MSLLQAAGISVELPPGWDGGIAEPTELEDGAVRQSVTHLASFPLPEQRGDYGGGAVQRMGWTDILIVLLEFDPASTAQPLFRRHGMPRSLRPSDFGRDTLQRRIEGHGGCQIFFQESGRAFCLYVVVGSYVDRADLIPTINQVLGRVRIS